MGSKESKIERQLVDGVKALGGMTFKFISPGRVGVPDRIVILPGGMVHFVELKTVRGRVSRQQEHMILRLRKLKTHAEVLIGADGVLAYLEFCRGLMSA